ncbi:type II toxin-antitoxin system RelE/ParE family toxin, partial [Burkholderia pseudomallei]|uniref:type II toxin-antitoxin system RelE/ParE family toxin n=1 Tax=Burkholderia pseudomallei TaxID=28450 RepID=UPI00217FFCB0
VNRLFFMTSFSPLEAILSSFNWSENSRAGHNGVWRVAFAFDPKRQAILLVGGDKGGADQRRFYKRLIAVADARFDEHLSALAAMKGTESKHAQKTR